jgi:hypothetical protein
MDIMTQFNADMAAASPAWVGLWVNVMVLVLALSIPFSFVRKESRWILLGTILGMAGTIVAYSHFGFTRILGIGHILFWTPTLLYMLRQRQNWKVSSTWFGKWITLAALVMAISLAFDVTDLARWLLGERASLV